MIVAPPDQQLLEALTSYAPVDRPGVELRIWDWDSPVHDVFGGEADDVVATILPHSRPVPAWRSLADLPKPRLLQAQLTGYDNLLCIIPDGVALANARGVHETSTSGLAVGLMLATQRKPPCQAHERHWQAASTRALVDSWVLVVGTGAIGGAIRSRLAPFEAEITRVATIAHDDERGHIHGIDELPKLFPSTNILVLIMLLTDSTRDPIGAKELTLLPNDALVVNVTRGPVVDTGAITAEVVAGQLWAASDMFDPEPFPGDHPLWQADRAFISLHIGGSAAAMLPRIVALLADQLSCLTDGRELRLVVKS